MNNTIIIIDDTLNFKDLRTSQILTSLQMLNSNYIYAFDTDLSELLQKNNIKIYSYIYICKNYSDYVKTILDRYHQTICKEIIINDNEECDIVDFLHKYISPISKPHSNVDYSYDFTVKRNTNTNNINNSKIWIQSDVKTSDCNLINPVKKIRR